LNRSLGTSTTTMLSYVTRPAKSVGSASGMIESTSWPSAFNAFTSSAATFSSPARTRMRGSPLTIVFESARSFWLNVSPAASTTARNVWKPGSLGLTRKTIRFEPALRSTRSIATWTPSAKSRTVAAWSMLELMSAIASISSPSRAVEGVVSRSTSTSSRSTSPMTRVSTWIPRAAASAASRWPRPVVSLPSEIRTIRFWAASGNSAAARRSAAPTSVAAFTGVLAMRSISRSSSGRRSTSASLPNATMPAWSSSGMTFERLAQERQRVLAPASPTLSDRSTTKTVASDRPAGRAGSRQARARAPQQDRPDASAARRRGRPCAAARRGAG
jgi:hypothetical protein